MVQLWWGLLGGAVGTFRKGKTKDRSTKRIILVFAGSAIQGVVLFVVLCPVAILYVFGIYISAGASLWRLIKHDFGNDGGANMKPALQVVYSLGVAQGILFGYKTIHAFAAKTRRVKFVYDELDKVVDEELVAEYLEETVAGCEKDPSFASGRNFVTYGVDLMKEATKSNEGFIAGIRVLGGATKNYSCGQGRKVLAKYLLTTSDSSSSAIIQKLLETVGPRSPYRREIKENVVRIMEIIGPCIRLEQFPRAIECLCSVVDTSEDSSNQERWGYNCQDDGQLVVLDTDWQSTTEEPHKFKDYERVELLEDYEKEYIKNGLRIGSPDISLGSTVLKLFQCLPCKRKEVESEREENVRSGLDRLLKRATNIMYKLVAGEDNIWILRTCVSNTVLRKIAKLPLKLHRENHGPFDKDFRPDDLRMLEQCWVLIERLLVALTVTSSLPLQPASPVHEERQRSSSEKTEVEMEEREEQLLLQSMDGSTSVLGSTIRRTIKDSIENTIKSVFDCLDCEVTQKMHAVEILLHLSLDMSFIDGESSKRRLSWVLLIVFCCTYDDSAEWMVPSLTYRNKKCCNFDGIRRLAGEKLSEILREKHGELPAEGTARELQLVGLALGDLKSAFDSDSEDISIRTHAIIIMEGLCRIHHTGYSEVDGFLVDAIPKVVNETLSLCDSKTAERQEQASDVEKAEVSQENQDCCIVTQRLRKALASLCYNGYISNYSDSSTIMSKFKEIASETCEKQGKSFGYFKRLIRQTIK